MLLNTVHKYVIYFVILFLVREHKGEFPVPLEYSSCIEKGEPDSQNIPQNLLEFRGIPGEFPVPQVWWGTRSQGI